MNTKQQIDAANKKAVELSNEWLARLRQVQAVAAQPGGAELPEIVLATIPFVQPGTATLQRGPNSPTCPATFVDATDHTVLDQPLEAALVEKPLPRELPLPQQSNPTASSGPPLETDQLLRMLSQHIDTSLVQIPHGNPDTESRHLPMRPEDAPIPKPLMPPGAAQSIPARRGSDQAPDSRQATRLKVDQTFFQLDHRQTGLRINRLIDRILEKIPPVNATSIAFGDSCNLVNTTFVSLQTAVGLAKRDLGPVLLVDADGDSSFLSRELCSREKIGFVQLIKENLAWQNAVYATDIEGFDFMPAGQIKAAPGGIFHVTRNNILRVLAELKQHYRYVCICAGNFERQLGLLSAAASDAAYLVIDLPTCDQDEVKQTVSQLTQAGARTLGCVSTEV